MTLTIMDLHSAIESFDLDQGARKRVEFSLERSRRGYPGDLRTPFAGKDRDRKTIIDEFEEYIGYTDFPELTAIDEEQKSKIGPYSIMLPWDERKYSVDEYGEQIWNADESAFDRAVMRVASLFPSGSLRPMGLDAACEAMPTGTLLGLPAFTSDESYIDQYLQRAKAANSAHDIYPAVAGWRGQPKGLNEIPKQRLVWMMDHASTILDLSILYPVLNPLRLKPGFSAWSSMDDVDEAVTSLITKAESMGVSIVSADYKSFDSSAHRNLIASAFDILRYWFINSAEPRINLCEEVFINCDLLTPSGLYTGRTGGVPSGSGLTNLIDTLINIIAGYYTAYRLGVELVAFEVLGDDSVFVFSQDLDMKTLENTMMELGLNCNPEKQFLSKHSVLFLQHWHSSEYKIDGISRGVRSPYRALNGMLSLERWVPNKWNKWMVTARLGMQVENCKWDSRFRSMVQYAKAHDEVLRSGVTLAVVMKRAGGASAVRDTLSIASYPFNTQDPEKVSKFATERILRELAH